MLDFARTHPAIASIIVGLTLTIVSFFWTVGASLLLRNSVTRCEVRELVVAGRSIPCVLCQDAHGAPAVSCGWTER